MKKIFYLSLLFSSINSFAQMGEWTWMSGDSVSQKEGVYGIQGVPSVLNHPPTLYEGCEWTDNSGNFWFYGGIHSDSMSTISTYGDLWRFNPTTLEWTWMNGQGILNQVPVYGTLRVPAATNHPGGRCFGPIGITDNNGIFWMFGGYNYGNGSFYSDLWSYDPSTNLWTWMSGQTGNLYAGSFGIQGVPSPTNYPPSKQECNAGWADSLNNIWVFGGQIPVGNGNDLWKYDITTYEWTWMKGDNTSNTPGVYGLQGIPDPANTPGGRTMYSKWTDSNHNFWLFGGVGASVFSDMWRYEVGSNEWTWMSGTSGNGSNGYDDFLCHFSALNYPGSRSENRTTWIDKCDNMFMYGGFGKSDLWVYSRLNNEWSKLFQSTNQPSYGIKGVSSPGNKPGDKGGASAWIDTNKNLWLFGGITGGMGYMDDLWRYVPDTSCIACLQGVPIAIFNAADNSICPGTCTDFIDLSTGATSYQWNFPGGNPSVSTAVNPSGICYNAPGNYSVTLIASNANGSDTLTLNNFITVYPYPPQQGISQSGDSLFANLGATSYQWYLNGVIIPGATDYFYVATQSGNYNVVATDENDCEVEAVINDVIAGLTPPLSKGEGVVFPNPVFETLYINGNELYMAEEISIYNMIGEKVMDVELQSSDYLKTPDGVQIKLDVSSLPSGAYFIELTAPEKVFRSRFVKRN